MQPVYVLRSSLAVTLLEAPHKPFDLSWLSVCISQVCAEADASAAVHLPSALQTPRDRALSSRSSRVLPYGIQAAD